MPSVNKVILVGNLGANPESRVMSSGEAVCSLRVATTEKWKDRTTGENREMTEWHRVVAFRRLAEIAADFLQKGSLVYVEGRLRTRKWQDKDGRDRFTTEIEAIELIVLGGGKQRTDLAPAPLHEETARSNTQAATRPLRAPLDLDDIPF